MTAIFIGLAALLAAVLVIKPSLGGRPYAFAVLFVLPVAVGLMGLDAHIEHSKQTSYCTSCHVMSKHERSLLVDDVTLLAASHYQGGRVPRERACFTCHTTYTMYGDFSAKVRGLKHLWVNYLGKAPEKLKLYTPYENRECLHCHDGARRFEKGETHTAEAGRMDKIRKGEVSCLGNGCHEFVHSADEVDGMPLWKPGGAK